MILRKIFIILTVVVATSLIGSGLLILGNLKYKSISKIEIYAEPKIDIENEKFVVDNTDESVLAVIENNESVVYDKMQNIEQVKSDINYNENKNNNIIGEELQKNNYTQYNESNKEEKIIENIVKQESNIQPKEDIYTFIRNDNEIQNMITITKRLIMENKDNRYSGLVDNVNNINFIIEKSGNIFYPLYEYRIANIVMDNYYPEFYVYAEDVYKNGEYLRTEYYFQ